jgi:hypothetical protein
MNLDGAGVDMNAEEGAGEAGAVSHVAGVAARDAPQIWQRVEVDGEAKDAATPRR